MPNYNRVKRKVKRNRLPIILLIVAIILGWIYLASRDSQIESPLSSVQKKEVKNKQSPTPSPNQSTQHLLEKEVKKLDGDYYIYLKDLNSNQIYSIRENEDVPSASIYKLAVMYKIYDEIAKGNIKKEDQLGEYTVGEALDKMITLSDNDTALLLAEKIGWSSINQFIKSENINGFNLVVEGYPTTTAKATGELLERIYTKKAVSQKYSQEMLELLLKQTKNDRIPLNLPVDIDVAHKTGELDNFRHDAGIVFGKKSDYIFVFLTETPRPEDAPAYIARLSKKMFEALERD